MALAAWVATLLGLTAPASAQTTRGVIVEQVSPPRPPATRPASPPPVRPLTTRPAPAGGAPTSPRAATPPAVQADSPPTRSASPATTVSPPAPPPPAPPPLPPLPLRAEYIPDPSAGPLLPDDVGTGDVIMRGRYARQWQQEDGTWVVVFNGGFQLDFGQRRLNADDAVVWIARRELDPAAAPSGATARPTTVYELTVHLSGRARVRETAGTTIEDDRLLVSNIRTTGTIEKFHDAHSPEVMEDSQLYQQALADRRRIEGDLPPETPDMPVAVRSPAEAPRRRPPRLITYRFGNMEPAQTAATEPVQVMTGGVYFAQTGGPLDPAVEIRANSAVVFLAQVRGAAFLDELAEPEDEPQAAAPAPPQQRPAGIEGGETAPRAAPRVEEPEPAEAGPLATLGRQQNIRAVYLEGDVVLTVGNRFVRASRLYYDFEQERALILDGVVRAELPERDVPLYVRAREIRQLSAREFAASNARVSTSEFYTPHYHIGAERVYIQDRSQLDERGRPTGAMAGTYELENTTFNIGGVPIAWWPYSRGDYTTSETLIRSFRLAHDDDFGTQINTRWYLFQLLGLGAPPGYDATLRADWFTDRGPAVGIDMDYLREDYFGLWRSYYIHDDGEDSLGPLRDNKPDTKDRGRVLWRHRHYLPEDWEATIELSYISDPGFLEEYEKNEWFEDKEQETVLYLKRAREVDAISLLANWRLLDFVTQTERLPELAYRRIGDTFASPLILYNESRVGWVRYRPDDRHLFDERFFSNEGGTHSLLRADLREEAELPIKLPGWAIVPFATGRGTYWEHQPLDEGSLGRGFGLLGVRGSTWLARVYDDIRSELLDINRIRHIVQPYFGAWWAAGNVDSREITPFTEGIETIDDFYGGVVGVKQTWETKRGALGRERTAELAVLTLEAGAFGDAEAQREYSNGYTNLFRPEDSRARNYISGDLRYRLSDTTSLLYDFNIDTNDWTADRHNISIAVERLPRLAYVFGHRYAHDIDMNLIGGGYNYQLTEKHLTALRVWYDLESGRLGEITFAYVRKLPRWYFGVTVEVDRVEDNVSFGISAWPEGIPEWTIGPRKFTGLAESAAIRPRP